MAGPILYSTNPWFSYDLGVRMRSGRHMVWCSEYFDPTTASTISGAAAIAPSSSPKAIFDTLKSVCEREDRHSHLIKDYRKTWKRLATDWYSKGDLTREQYDEIVASVKAPSWRIWRPLLYIIPRQPIEASGRLESVPLAKRAATHGLEFRIADLATNEFDIIECRL